MLNKKSFRLACEVFIWALTLVLAKAQDPAYTNTAHLVPGHIEAENFIRTAGAVNVQAVSRYEAGGGEVVRNFSNGSKVSYPINVESTGLYEIKIRYASAGSGSTSMTLNSNGTLLSTSALAPTSAANVYETFTLQDIPLVAGAQTFEVTITGSGSTLGNTSVNWLAFRRLASTAAPEYELYVSPTGNDGADGTLQNPYQTLLRAITRVQELNFEEPDHGPIVIWMRDGYHEVTSTINMGAAWRQTADGHVTVRPYQNEKAIIGGGRQVPLSSLSLVTDSATLARLHPNARGRVYRAVLNDSDWISRFAGGQRRPTVSYSGNLLQQARYPNKGLSAASDYTTTGNTFKLSPSISNPTLWAAELARSNDIQIIGHLSTDEFENTASVTGVSSDGTITLNQSGLFTGAGTRRLRIFNVLSELDIAGEYYYDKVSNELLIWPPAPLSLEPDIRVGSSFLVINQGNCTYWTWRDLFFQDVGGADVNGNLLPNGFVFTGDNFVIGGNTFRNTRSRATMRVTGRFNRVTGNNYFDNSTPYVVSGSSADLTLPARPSQSEFTNNYIRDNIGRAYGAGGFSGTAILFSNNVTHSVQAGKTYTTSLDGLLELNEWYDLSYELGDVNVAYVGASYNSWGTVIRHNFVHNMVMPGDRKRVGPFRGDDGTAGLTFVGNILYKTGEYGFANTRTGAVMSNNVGVETYGLILSGVRPEERIDTAQEIANEWARQQAVTANPQKDHYIFKAEQLLGENFWMTPHFEYKYPIIRNAFDTNPWDSVGMEAINNYVSNVTLPLNSIRATPTVLDYIPVSEAPVSIPTSTFENLDVLDMRFKSNFTPMTGFWEIPFERIGLYEDEFRPSTPHKETYRANAKLKWASRNSRSSNIPGGSSVRGDVNEFYPDPNFLQTTVYDLGTYTSSLQPLATLVTHQTTGTYGWNNTSGLSVVDRGASQNALNRDVIISNQTRIFEQEVENGDWYALITFGDTVARSQMSVRAEGGGFEAGNENFNTNAGQYINKFVRANVTDGRLSIEISSSAGWSVTRIITQMAPFGGQTALTSSSGDFSSLDTYQHDFGTESSNVFTAYSRITDNTTRGFVRWEDRNGLSSADRGGSDNNLNRDFVSGTEPRVLVHQVDNGNYLVTLNMYDSTRVLDGMQVRAEGEVKISSLSTGGGAGNLTQNFTVVVNDGFLNLEFSDQGGSSLGWALNRLRIIREDTTDTGSFINLNPYSYDFGLEDSPVREGDFRITQNTVQGYAKWQSNVNLDARDRNVGANDIRDFVLSSQPQIFSHELENGLYVVTISANDPITEHDEMQVRAEGEIVISGFTAGGATGEQSRDFCLEVSDGVLDLEFSDQGGNDPSWILNRLVISRRVKENSGPFVEQDIYQYDFGPTGSASFPEYTQLTNNASLGYVRWNNICDLEAAYYPEVVANGLNQDLVASRETRELLHELLPGTYRVTLNMWDAMNFPGGMFVKAEGESVIIEEFIGDDDFNPTFGFPIAVVDGVLNLEFSAEDIDFPEEASWAVNRIVIEKTGEVVTNSGPFVDQESYFYDVGTAASPVIQGLDDEYVRLSNIITEGYVRWVDNSDLSAVYRSNGSSNVINNDYVMSSQPKALIHQLRPGIYNITVNMFDEGRVLDNMQVKAEGVVKIANLTTGSVNGNPTTSFSVNVFDGFLDLEFSGQGGIDSSWVLNRIVITRTGDLPLSVDSDGDGLSDAREAELGTNPNVADSDGDGQSDGFEDEAGTDPNDDSNRFEIVDIVPMAGVNQYEITWNSGAGKTYRLFESDNLEGGFWSEVSGSTPSEGFTTDEVVTQPARRKFYRVEVVVP